MASRIFFYIIILLTISINAFSQKQEHKIFTEIIKSDSLREWILFMSDSLCNGRATGSQGAEMVRGRIIRNFKDHGIKPILPMHYTQSFETNGVIGRNVIGYISAFPPTDKSIIIGAHYDNIGCLNGKIYPGADANASGVAALASLANIFGSMNMANFKPKINIIFVTFDAKELSMAGSKFFAENLPLKAEEVTCAINLDQVGSSLAPPRNDSNYVLILGKNYLPKHISEQISICNLNLQQPLDIDDTFYGSKSFHDTFYRLSDHYALHKKNIPAIMITAGINKNNYKPTDTERFISYPVLINRIKLVYRLIYKLAY